MKKIYLLTLFVVLSTLFTSCVSTKKLLDSPPSKTKLIANKGTKNSNFIKANEWMVETFNDAESVIQFTDKEAGIVKGKYVMRKGSVSAGLYGTTTTVEPFYAIITIRVKDKASKIEIDPPSGMYTQKAMDVEYGFTPEQFNLETDVLLASFEKAMLSKSANEDW